MPTAKQYWQKVNGGICVDCSAEALPTLKRCAFHHEQNLKAHRRYYQRHRPKMLRKREAEFKRMKTEGRCMACFNPLYTDGPRCPDCMEKQLR